MFWLVTFQTRRLRRRELILASIRARCPIKRPFVKVKPRGRLFYLNVRVFRSERPPMINRDFDTRLGAQKYGSCLDPRARRANVRRRRIAGGRRSPFGARSVHGFWVRIHSRMDDLHYDTEYPG